MRDPSQDLHNKILGREAERAVGKYLKKRGYKILERNFKTPFGEADLIARSPQGFTCFVEVKARLTHEFGSPAEAVIPPKQQRYRMIAKYWVSLQKREVPIRFDVAAVDGDAIEYFEDAYI